MIQRIALWLNRETSNITVAAMFLAAASFAADILGLVRDRILAAQFGAGDILDVYYVGFRIPDILLNLLILGAMSSAFLPVFAERFAKDEKDAWQLASNLLTLAGIALIVLAAALFLFIPFLLPLVAPGFDAIHIGRAVHITRILLLSPILFGLSSIVSAILHYFQRFYLYSLAPILYNFGIIIGAVFFAPRFQEEGLALGVVLGAILHLSIQLPGLRLVGFSFKTILRPVHGAVRDVVRLAIPRTANLLVNQLQLTALTALASAFIAGSIAVFNFGMNLAFVPVGVIGISFAVAAFPALSRAAASQENEKFSRTLSQTIQEILFFALPATALFLVLRAHIVRTVLGSGAFSWEDTRLTAAVLGALALGVVAQSLLPLIVRAYFARKDTMTPFLISLVGAITTVAMALLLGASLKGDGQIRHVIGMLFRIDDLSDIRVLALPLAMTIMTTLQIIALLIILERGLVAQEFQHLLGAFGRLSLSSLVAGCAAWLTLHFTAHGVAQQTFIGIFLQGAVAGMVGVIVFLILAFTFAFPEARRFVVIIRDAMPPLAAILPDLREVGDDAAGRDLERRPD